jgi:signal transduction histidine kinase
VAARPGGAEVTVRDNGCGIPPQLAGRLFRPYFTTKKHGTGLGLFVTRQLVTEHGGMITFESRPGEGTTFRVFLPAVAPPRKDEVRRTRDESERVPSASPLLLLPSNCNGKEGV